MIIDYKTLFFELQNKKIKHGLNNKLFDILLKVEEWYIHEQELIISNWRR
jgi:hypothetical protein